MSFWVSLVLPSFPQVPHFMPYFMHTNNADSRRCTRGWTAPCHLLAAQSLTLNIAQKQVIAHVEGVDVISVRRIFIFLFV